MLLDDGEKVIFVIKWQRTWWDYVHVLVFLWEVELRSNEIGYLAEEISKQGIEGTAWILLIAYSKMGGKR